MSKFTKEEIKTILMNRVIEERRKRDKLGWPITEEKRLEEKGIEAKIEAYEDIIKLLENLE